MNTNFVMVNGEPVKTQVRYLFDDFYFDTVEEVEEYMCIEEGRKLLREELSYFEYEELDVADKVVDLLIKKKVFSMNMLIECLKRSKNVEESDET